MEFLSKGRDLPCLDSKGGIKTIYLAKWTNDLVYTYDVDGVVTFGEDITFNKFESNNISYVLNLENSDEGEIYAMDIGFDMYQVDKTTSDLLNSMSDMLLVAIVVDQYDTNHVFGLDSGLDISLSETTGSAKSSFSGYNIKLKGFQENKYFVNEIPNQPQFILLANGVTVRYLGSTAGETGYINDDPITYPTLYTAYDQTMWDAVTGSNFDPLIDFTSVCTTLVNDMSFSFFPAISFNENISHFDTSNVTNMFLMFFASSFNQPIGDWNVSSVSNMNGIFNSTPFNQPLNNWDVSNVINMNEMFKNTPFNQDISSWDVSNVTNMIQMFENNNDFNQVLTSWCVENIPSEPTNFAEATFLPANRPLWGVIC